jgi:peptidyl-lysine (3S)-dioxygenase / protease
MDKVDEAIASAINTYHELNAAVVDELIEEPSPLEFMRFVASNRPFVVRKAAREWKAIQLWIAEYLLEVMGDANVEVAVTPHG